MKTLTIEYDARNKGVEQIINGLLSMGVFHIKEDAVYISQPANQREKILSYAGAFNDMSEEDYSIFLNEVERTRNDMFNRDMTL
jgi:hypothetical protein